MIESQRKRYVYRRRSVYKVVLPREAATIVLDYQTLSPNVVSIHGCLCVCCPRT